MIEELLEKAFTGDEDAQAEIIRTLIDNPENELLKGRLKEYAHLGWKEAQSNYCWGLASGGFGIDQDPKELKKLADLGWFSAQFHYCAGLAYGQGGISQDPIELKKLADLGWKYAQYCYCVGLDNGIYGITQDPDLSKELKTLWNVK